MYMYTYIYMDTCKYIVLCILGIRHFDDSSTPIFHHAVYFSHKFCWVYNMTCF